MAPKPLRSGPAVAVATTEPRVRPASPGGSIAEPTRRERQIGRCVGRQPGARALHPHVPALFVRRAQQ